jgi:hypothetical protein
MTPLFQLRTIHLAVVALLAALAGLPSTVFAEPASSAAGWTLTHGGATVPIDPTTATMVLVVIAADELAKRDCKVKGRTTVAQYPRIKCKGFKCKKTGTVKIKAPRVSCPTVQPQ